MIDALMLSRYRTRLAVRHVVLVASAAAALFVGVAAAAADGKDAGLKADEQEMLAKARVEADERRRSRRVLDGSVGVPASETASGRIVNIGEPLAAEKDALERQRQSELQRLSDKLRRASAARPMKPSVPVATPWATEVTVAATETPVSPPRPALQPESRSALGQRPNLTVPSATADQDNRVTVLMVMAPGDRGIRRFDKTADPILCTSDGCYISNGAATSAQFVSLRRTFGFANTFGPRAGACRHQTGCVFRGVDISAANAVLQPVDLKVLVHDRRTLKSVAVDPTCRVDSGQLSCGRPIRGETYTLWVVPEAVATRAGSAALLKAVEDGLADGATKASLPN